MNLETKITIYKFTPQLFTLTQKIQYLLSEIVKKKYRKRPNIQSLYDFEQPIKHDKV